jgi:hypothetical protein
MHIKWKEVCVSKIQNYEIEVPEGTPTTQSAFIALVEENGHLFKGLVMADYRGDCRYEYQPDSFKVTDVNSECWSDGSFEFEVDVQYFEGCKDKDFVDSIPGTVEFSYDKSSRLIKFELNETIWNPDN